jgi:hypothetical protein
MADVKREVTALGQKVVGLKAGDNYTLVLKRPKPKVDATNAKTSSRTIKSQIEAAKTAIAQLLDAKGAVDRGDRKNAQALWERASSVVDDLRGAISSAKDYAELAGDDVKQAQSEVKEAYQAAKDAADLSVQHAEKVADGMAEAVRTVGALIEHAITLE